jgi:hypothetical protein
MDHRDAVPFSTIVDVDRCRDAQFIGRELDAFALGGDEIEGQVGDATRMARPAASWVLRMAGEEDHVLAGGDASRMPGERWLPA